MKPMIFIRGIFLIFFCSCCALLGSAQEADPVSNVTMEINLVRITLNDEHQDGVDWEAIVSDFHNLFLKKEDNPIWTDKKHMVSVGTVSKEDYAVLLDALDTVGTMTQIPQPAVVLEPGIKQSLDVVSSDGATSANIRIEQTVVLDKGTLEVQLAPYVGVFLKDSGKLIATTLKAQTDVELKENTTIVLGGIMSENEITKTHKFPLLGSLPLVGMVFRIHGHLVQRTETIIFLTPHIHRSALADVDKT